MNLLYLSLGSNRGDRLAYLRQATVLIGESIGRVTRCSPVYETPPWGFSDPTPFYNCCIQVSTVLSAEDVMKGILAIETELGRKRGGESALEEPPQRYRSRTIDIDILFYNNIILNTAGLVIPHPRITSRRFVLEPLNAICPDLVHPVLKKTVRELLAQCGDASEVSVLLLHL